jgi:hypothetical protein
MRSKVLFPNTLAYFIPSTHFTTAYPNTSYRGLSIELSLSSSPLLSYAGHFDLDVIAPIGLLGFYCISRFSRVSGRPGPILGVPAPTAQPPVFITLLPPVLQEFIGCGLLCGLDNDSSSRLNVSVVYRLHREDAICLTFCYDTLSFDGVFSIGVLFRFDSSIQVQK